MPNTTSAKKRLRQNDTRRARNRSVKRTLRTLLRNVREAIAAGNVGESETQARNLNKRFDQAAAKKIVHPNMAARVKSRVSARIKSLKKSGSAK